MRERGGVREPGRGELALIAVSKLIAVDRFVCGGEVSTERPFVL